MKKLLLCLLTLGLLARPAAATIRLRAGSLKRRPRSTSGTTVTLMTHDSFYVGDSVFEAFTAETSTAVELLGWCRHDGE